MADEPEPNTDPHVEIIESLINIVDDPDEIVDNDDRLNAAEVLLTYYRKWLNHNMRPDHPMRIGISEVISAIRGIVFDENAEAKDRIRAAKLVLQ